MTKQKFNSPPQKIIVHKDHLLVALQYCGYAARDIKEVKDAPHYGEGMIEVEFEFPTPTPPVIKWGQTVGAIAAVCNVVLGLMVLGLMVLFALLWAKIGK